MIVLAFWVILACVVLANRWGMFSRNKKVEVAVNRALSWIGVILLLLFIWAAYYANFELLPRARSGSLHSGAAVHFNDAFALILAFPRLSAR